MQDAERVKQAESDATAAWPWEVQTYESALVAHLLYDAGEDFQYGAAANRALIAGYRALLFSQDTDSNPHAVVSGDAARVIMQSVYYAERQSRLPRDAYVPIGEWPDAWPKGATWPLRLLTRVAAALAVVHHREAQALPGGDVCRERKQDVAAL